MAFGDQAATRAASVRRDIRFPRRQPYLASPASDFMTGQTVYLDGGQSAG